MSLHRYLSLFEKAGPTSLWLDAQRHSGDLLVKVREAEAEANEKSADKWDDQIRAECNQGE